MDVALWILFGAITAWIAEIFIGIHTGSRILGIVVLGVVAAVLAGASMQIITGNNDGNLNFYSLLLAIAGSLSIVALVTHRKA